MTTLTESDVEQAALAWLDNLGWSVAHGPDIAPGTPDAQRTDYSDVILAQRLRDALARLNPDLPTDALDDAFRKLTRPQGTTLEARNRAFHRMTVDGVTVEYRDPDGAMRGDQARVIDFDEPCQQRLAGGQPVHRRGEQARTPTRRGAVRQRPAAGGHRAEEPGR